MTAPRARERSDPPSPPDGRPPRRGGGSSPSASAASAGRPADLARPGAARRGLVRSARALAAAALLAALGALALPATAQAEELVSNLGETSTSGGGRAGPFDNAQGFRTGDSAKGYALTNVRVKIHTPPPAGKQVTVTVMTASGGKPSTVHANLTAPSSIVAGNNTFSAPAGTILAGGRRSYFVVVMSDDDTDTVKIGTTNSDDQGPDMTDWRIDNDRLSRHDTETNWNTTFTSGHSLILRINGEESSTDVTPPTLTDAEVPSNGRSLELEFNEDLDLPSTIPSGLKDAFSVTADGHAMEISSIAKDGSDGLKLNLSARILEDQDVVVSYDRSDAGSNALDDDDGNEVRDFTTGEGGVPDVDNGSTVNPPKLRSGSQVRNNGEIFLFFDENLSDSVPLASAFSITADGSPISVGSVSHPTGDSLKLAGLSPRIGEDQRVRLRYTDPTTGDDANAVQDIHGVDAASFTISDVTNNSTITLPALSAAAVPASGGTVALTFSRDLDFSETFTATIRDAFSVTVDGTANAVTGFGGSGDTATLTMADTIAGGQTVVVGYDRSDAGGEALADDDDDKKQVADFSTGEDGVPAVANNSTAGPARLASAAVDAAGTQLTLTFNKSLNAETSLPAWFTVTADGVEIRSNGFAGLNNAGDSFAILFSVGSPIYKDEAVVVVYEKPAGSDGLTDEANDVPVASFTTGEDGVPAVTNAATTVAPPKPDTAAGTSKVGTGGSALVLAFDGPLAIDNKPPASAFSITAGGVAIGIGAVLLSSSTTAGAVSLAGLTPKVRQGETVTLTYTDPTSADDTNALQGTTGTDVRSFTLTLTNASTVTTGPPRPPTGLAATALGATIVDLAWTAPANDGDSAITGYKVEVSNTGSSGWTDLAADTGDANAWYRHSGLSNGDTRYYRVSAINANGTSPASATANATTMTGAPHAVDPATIYGTPLWSATLTVGTTYLSLGYDVGPPVAGALTPDTFDRGGTRTVTVFELYPQRDSGTFNIDPPLGLGLFTIHVGRGRAEFSDVSGNSKSFSGLGGINYSHGDRVDIRLMEATAPAKPTGFTATAAGNAQIDLAWTAPEDDGGRAVSGYKVEVSDDGSSGSWSEHVADTASTDTAYSHTGLSAGQTRHYRVSAINAAGTSDESDSDEATTQRTAPDPPEVSAIADGTSKIVVSWRAPANDGGSAITGYRLQVSNNGVSGWSNLVEDTTDTSYEHTGLSAGTTHHYRVYATNGIGTSQPSAVVSDMTQPGATSCTPNPGDYWCGVVTVEKYTVGGLDFANGFVDASVTTNPSDTGALSDETFSVGPNNYTIDTAATGLEGLAGRLEFGLTSTLSATDQAKLVLHVGSRSFAFSDAPADSTHDHIWDSGLDWSSSTSITLRLRRVPAAPGAPTNLMAEADGGTTIELSWTAPADDGGSAITGYRIEVSNNGSSNWSDLEADTGNADTSYTHDGLSPGDTRHYRVSAINANGRSEASDSDDATTADPPTLSSAEVGSTGERITLDFSENLNLQAEALPTAAGNAFTVNVDRVERQFHNITWGGQGLGRDKVLINFATKIYQGQTVVVSYDQSVAGSDAIADSDGDEVASFTTGVAGVPAVVNNSTRTPPLPAPTNFRAMAGDGEVTLSWDEPASDSGVTHHDYRFRTDGDYEGWIEIDDSGPGETNASGFTVRPLENETEYTFELRAGGDDGNSLAADEVEAHARLNPVLVEPFEARAEVGAAPALDDDLVGQVVRGVLGRVLHRRVDLEDMNALGLDLGRDFAELGPEVREGPGRQRAGGVDDDGDRVHALRADGGEIEAAVDEAPVRETPAIVPARRVGHVAAQEAAPVEGAGVGVAHRLLDPARELPFGPGEVHGLVHGLVPRLLLGGDVHRRFTLTVAAAGARVHDLAGAGGIVARRRVGHAVPVPAVIVRTVLPLSAAVFGRAGVIVIAGAVGGVGLVVGRIVIAIADTGRLGDRGGAHRAASRRRIAVAAGLVLPGLGQAVVCFLYAHPVQRLGVGRQGEARVANERMGDELRGELPALRVALASPRVVFQRARHDHARHRRLDDVGVGGRHPPGRVADLVPVARQRLPARVGPQREPQGEAPEEGLLAQELGHAVAHALRGFLDHAGGHHAASRAGSAGAPKYPANFSISSSASRFTRVRAMGSKDLDGRSASGSTLAIFSFTCSQSRASSSSPKMLRRGTTSTRSRMFEIIESRNTSGLPFSSSCNRSETRSTASPKRR